MEYTRTVDLLSGATATGAGTAKSNPAGVKTFQADGTTSAGAGAATIIVKGRCRPGVGSWDTIGTITLTLGTTATSDSFTSDDRYGEVCGEVTAISGTDASVNLSMGF